ncbi:MAG: PD-(D/E)XK nuclease family protein [Verrucomicrobiae bacterium]|nr:PD-(D/E)XK nuclease family protein [Verrucomicrobiae bacterium]
MPDRSQMDLFNSEPSPKRVPPRRAFLPWDRPLLERAAEWLLDRAGPDLPIDLSHLLVVVPTRNAGRRLREMLANLADERGTAIVPPLAAPPAFLLASGGEDSATVSPIAGEIEALASWIAVLTDTDLQEYRGLFPIDPPDQDFRWARSTARDLTSLRSVLGEAGLSFAEVSRRLPADHEEADRWADLEKLEARWWSFLGRRLDRVDREEARRRSARAPRLPDGIREVILLATPDPFPLAIDALEALAAREIPITIVTYAPESLAAAFDEWGRPLADFWLREPLDLPDFQHSVQLVANPDELLTRVADLAAAIPAPEETLAIGAVDGDLAPLLESTLRVRGIPAFNPDGGRVSREGFHHLLTILADLLGGPDFPAFREWLRIPEVDAWLSQRLERWNGPAARAALDDAHAFHLPGGLGEMRRFLEADAARVPAERDWERTRIESAIAAIGETEALLRSISRGPLEETLSSAMREVVGARRRAGESGAWAEKTIEAAAPELMRGLSQLGALERAGVHWEIGDRLSLLTEFTGAASVGEDRPPRAIELQGWLELLWEDAPHLVIAGLNDGIVPEAIAGDVFLPENLRKLRALRLRTNEDRLVRDLYLLRALLEPRRAAGRLDLLVPKTNADGEPRRPSRLLLRCRDDELPERVSHLFREIETSGSQLPWSPGFRLVPGLERAGAPEKPVAPVAVTAFSTFLASPFRFWTTQRLRLSRIEPEKAEMDDLDFGNLCHEALERYGNDPEARAWTDASRIEEFLLAAVDALARERFGERPGLAVRIQVEAARHRLAAAAEREAAERADGWEIIGVEARLGDGYPLALGGVEISGKIDRIEQRGDVVRVLDFKTSDARQRPRPEHFVESRLGDEPEWPPAYAIFRHADFSARSASAPPVEKIYRFKNLQIPLYALALSRALPDRRIEGGYFHLTKAVSDIGPDTWTIDAGLLEAARVCAEGVIADVLAGKFGRLDPARQNDSLETWHLGVPLRTLDLTHVGGGDNRPLTS